VQDIIVRMREFVDEVYVPDTLAIAGFYKEWATQGEGLGNFMCYGDFPAKSIFETAGFLVPRGVILNRDLSHIEEVDLHDPAQIEEFVSHAYYDYDGGKDRGLHPFEGETTLNYTGPAPPYSQLDVARGYSWMKSPRWRGKAVEVGPLARMLMLVATGHAQAKQLVDQALSTLQLPLAGLYSTLGRTAARTLETKIFVDALQGWYEQLLANVKAGNTQTFDDRYWDPATWPAQARGAGFMEAPRGALGHWIVIEDGRIDNYQAVVPSTWNAGPRDATGQAGAYEAALAGHVLHDPDQPIEILRTIHSFDPCIACAVHVLDPDGGDAMSVRVR
jgi:hydrogenase large subunit